MYPFLPLGPARLWKSLATQAALPESASWVLCPRNSLYRGRTRIERKPPPDSRARRDVGWMRSRLQEKGTSVLLRVLDVARIAGGAIAGFRGGNRQTVPPPILAACGGWPS